MSYLGDQLEDSSPVQWLCNCLRRNQAKQAPAIRFNCGRVVLASRSCSPLTEGSNVIGRETALPMESTKPYLNIKKTPKLYLCVTRFSARHLSPAAIARVGRPLWDKWFLKCVEFSMSLNCQNIIILTNLGRKVLWVFVCFCKMQSQHFPMSFCRHTTNQFSDPMIQDAYKHFLRIPQLWHFLLNPAILSFHSPNVRLRSDLKCKVIP